jgi:acetyl-CoA carboxylase biotin carboxyl carrier protein
VQKQGAARAAPDEAPARAQPSTSPVAPQQSNAAPVAAPAAAVPVEVVPEGMVAVRSPMLGTFYRAPSPGEKPFVEVGSRVTPEETVCLVEVMKLFNSIKAGVAGRVARIPVENGAMVEHAQLLILIEPDAGNA